MKRHHPSCWKSLVASASGSSTSVSHAFEQNSKRNSKKNLRQRHPGWIFQGMLMPNTAACPAMWHFAGIQSQSRLTSSRCKYKHLKFTGQVLLNVVQRALTNEQVLEMAKSPAGNSKGLAAVETARSQKDVSGFTSQWLPIASQQWLAQWKVSNQRLPRLCDSSGLL